MADVFGFFQVFGTIAMKTCAIMVIAKMCFETKCLNIKNI